MTTLRDRLHAITTSLQIEAKQARLLEVEQLSQDPGLWEDSERAATIMSEVSSLQQFLSSWKDVWELSEMEAELSESELRELESDVKGFERQALLSGKTDGNSA